MEDYSCKLLKTVIDNASFSIIATDVNGTITCFNHYAEIMLGYEADEVVGICTPMVFHKEEEVLREKKAIEAECGIVIDNIFDVFVYKSSRWFKNSVEWTYITKDKKDVIIRLFVTTMLDENGNKCGYLGMAEDISEYKRLKLRQEQYLKILDENVITSRTDLGGFITMASKAFCNISGYTQEELLGKPHNIVRHPDMPKSVFKDMWEVIQNNKVWEGEIKNLKKDGGYYWVKATISPDFDERGYKIGYTAIRHDITDKKTVEELAVLDKLTGLYNRLKLDEVFEYELAKVKRYHEALSLIMVDIDKFKSVNDNYGHQVGDLVLRDLAKILKSSIRQTDTLGRWGGEEFLIICPQTDIKSAYSIADKIRQKIEEYSFSIVGCRTASFGVASYVDDDIQETLISRADKALYMAKESGRNRVVILS